MITKSNYENVVDANIAMHTRLAENYNTDEPHFRPENIKKVESRLVDIFNKTNAARLLDLGCGTGFIINIAKKYVKEIDGVDITQAMLDKIDSSGSAKIRIFKNDTGTFPIDIGAYDVVTAYSFLHHLYDIEPTLLTAYKALKNGGKLYADLEPNFYFWEIINKLERSEDNDPIISREIEMVKYKSEDFMKNLNLTKKIVDFAEYGKNVLGGFKEEELKSTLLNIGFSEVKVFYYWYIGQAALINDSNKPKEERFKDAETVNDLLQKILPVSRSVFKYLGFIATK